MNRSHRALVLAAATALLVSSCGADDDDAGTEPTAAPENAEADQQAEDQQEQVQEEEVFAEAEITDQAGNPLGTVTASHTEEGVRIAAEVHSLTPGFRGIGIHETGVCEIASADEFGQIGDFLSAGELLAGSPEEDLGTVEGEDELAETPPAEEGVPENSQEDTTDQAEPGQPTTEQPSTEQPGTGQPGTGEDQGQPAPPQGAEAPGGSAAPQASGAVIRPAAYLQSQPGATAPPPQTDPEAEIDRPERAGALPNLLINEDRTGYLETISHRLTEELLLDGDGAAVIIYTAADHHGNIPQRYAPYGPDEVSRTTGDTGDRVGCGVLEPSGGDQ